MMCLSLTASEAAQVRGPTGTNTALEPIPLVDGSFILGLDVIDDPANAEFHDLLSALPTREVSAADFPSPFKSRGANP